MNTVKSVESRGLKLTVLSSLLAVTQALFLYVDRFSGASSTVSTDNGRSCKHWLHQRRLHRRM